MVHVGALKVDEGTLDAAKYARLISNTLKENAHRLCGDDFIFQQHGDGCHTARSTISWFQRQGIPLIHPWPPQRVDLNPY